MEFINIWLVYIRGEWEGHGGGMGGGKPGLKQRSKTAPWYRVYSGYDIHIHPQRVSIPLQLTVGAI